MFARWPRRGTAALDRHAAALHLNVPEGTFLERQELIVEALVAEVDQVTRARLGADPKDAIYAAMENPDGYPPGWEENVAAAVNGVLEDSFPRVDPDDADVEYATFVAVTALAAIVAAGLPVDTARVAVVARTVLVSMQKEVAG